MKRLLESYDFTKPFQLKTPHKISDWLALNDFACLQWEILNYIFTS